MSLSHFPDLRLDLYHHHHFQKTKIRQPVCVNVSR